MTVSWEVRDEGWRGGVVAIAGDGEDAKRVAISASVSSLPAGPNQAKAAGLSRSVTGTATEAQPQAESGRAAGASSTSNVAAAAASRRCASRSRS